MSDEQINKPSDAPDGAGEAPNPEMMSVVEAKKIIEQRQRFKAEAASAGEKLATSAATIAELTAKLEAQAKPDAPPDSPKKSDPDAPPPWAQALMTKVEGLDASFTTHKATTAKDAVLADVLKQIPDGKHKTATALLGTLGVDFTQPGAAADALTILRTDHASVLVDSERGTQHRAKQVKPDGSPNFDMYKSLDEVPDEWKIPAMRDPATFERLMKASTGAASDEYCI